MPISVYLAILGGGAAGAVCRHLLDTWIMNSLAVYFPAISPFLYFPAGILAVNVLGAFCMGALAGTLSRSGKDYLALHSLLGTGFLGSFTTFSTFSLNTFSLFLLEGLLPALANILLNVLLGLLAVWAGFRLFGPRRAAAPSGSRAE